MSQAEDWVLLAYRLPRVPSTPRSAVWRKLKRLGVAQLGDGLVALEIGQQVHHAAMGKGNAVGLAGRAGGVHEVSQVVGADRAGGIVLRLLADERGVCLKADVRTVEAGKVLS